MMGELCCSHYHNLIFFKKVQGTITLVHLQGMKNIPLWQRAIPKYPIYWKGDPQLRIFLPLFWMKLVRPQFNERKDKVHFITHPQMSEDDVKQYLKKIYNVDAIRITLENRAAPKRYSQYRGYKYPDDPDIKYAYVYLKEGQEFTFPDLFNKENMPSEKMLEEYKKIDSQFKEQKRKHHGRLDIPQWFR